MKGQTGYLIILVFVLLFSGCQYRKGKSFTWSGTGDTVNYIIATAGPGRLVLKKLNRKLRIHENKEDECRVVFISDSASLAGTRSVLLFNSALPDIKKDMLSKGFIGTFATRQVITYLVVSGSDFEKYLTPSK